MSVVDDILKLNVAKRDAEADALRQASDKILKGNTNNVATSELLDLVFSATGYQHAPVPGGETVACGRIVELIIEYMSSRAKSLTNKGNSLDDGILQTQTLNELIAKCARLYSELSANLPPEQS